MMMMNEYERNSDDENRSVEVIEEISHKSPIEDRIISRVETRRVTQLKLLVLFILVVSAITVGCGVFFYMRGSEQAKFHDNLNSDANKIFESIGYGVEDGISILDVMATTIVTHARETNQSWPFVVLPYFANRASKTLTITNGIALFFSVLVQPDERLAWEEFVWDHRDILVNQSNHVMETDRNYRGKPNWALPLSREIYDSEPIPYNVSREFCPSWQQYPMPSNNFSGINWDWYTSPEALDYLKIQTNEKRRAVISSPYILPDPNNADEVAEAQYWADAYQSFIPPKDNPFEPVSDILYPIMDIIDNNLEYQYATNQSQPMPKVVGNIVTTIYWRDLIRNILPNDRKGLVLVVDNPCQSSFTYKINGPIVEFMGRGDHHDTSFDSLRLRREFVNLKKNSLINCKYTGVPVNNEYCPFTFNIYPSQEMQDIYITNNPAIFTIVAIFIFVFTSIVFIVYDSRVERRQKLIMTSAIRSNAVVSSLFPSNVREVVLKNSMNPKMPRTDPSEVSKGTKRLSNSSDDTTASAPPIADLYPDTTVLFADIKGFTAWSSARDPHQVFTLLETIYGEFDKLARERKVFKVETIGDSYVAVTGLPEPMKNHAVVMAKFADAMLRKAREVVHDLVTSLGPGTDELCLRVGLNSGPTTAGVLRGEKSRFQLFGDTVNTASRMESTGLPTKIQCSQRTADLLIANGKEHWVTKRADPVQAKGKGTMETYWVSPSGRKTSDACEKTDLFIEWNVNLFLDLLYDLVTSRKEKLDGIESPVKFQNNAMVLRRCNSKKFGVSGAVDDQVKSFVVNVSSMYSGNHKFEHTNHVVMGMKSLLDNVKEKAMVIIDPFDRFCILFAVLIHDINNGTKCFQESPQETFNAELNVVDTVWNLLTTPKFQDFRKCFCTDDADRDRFFAIVSTVVSLNETVSKSSTTSEIITDSQIKTDFIQQLFRVAQRIHAMQHWHVYQKWNKYLFCQAFDRYRDGQAEDNPYETWFLQEFYNFDLVVIPLIVKLKEFDLLGNVCETLLRFAEDNRLEWEAKGQDSIAEWMKDLNQGIHSRTFSVTNSVSL